MTLDNYKSTLEFLIWFPWCIFFVLWNHGCTDVLNFRGEQNFIRNFFKNQEFIKKILRDSRVLIHTTTLHSSITIYGLGSVSKKIILSGAVGIWCETLVLCICSNTFEEEFFFLTRFPTSFRYVNPVQSSRNQQVISLAVNCVLCTSCTVILRYARAFSEPSLTADNSNWLCQPLPNNFNFT